VTIRTAGHPSMAHRPGWLPVEEFPFVSRQLEVDGHRLHYVDEGSGPLLLLVHVGTWSFVWRDLMVALRADFRCVTLDFPGSGLSVPADAYEASLEGAADVLRAFVRRLELDDATLVVHDLGGPVALLAFAGMPELVRGLVVAESFCWPLGVENPKVARMLRLVGSPAVRALDATTNVVARMTSTSFGVGRHVSRPGRRAFRGPFRDRAVRARMLAMLGGAGRSDETLARVEAVVRGPLADRPVLLTFGAKSPAVKEGFPERWRERLPHAGLLLVDGGHHFPMCDDPSLVARAISGWYREEVVARP